jgi:hypothetical protein
MTIDSNLASIVLLVVAVATALNLFLTFRLARRLRGDRGAEPLTVAIGALLPAVAGRRPGNGAAVRTSDFAGEAAVLIFLSSYCPACRTAVAEICGILPGTRVEGVALWIVGIGDVEELVGGTELDDHRVELDSAALAALNPNRAAPAYIFVDSGGTARASDFIGDPDWRLFEAQMRSAADSAEPAS